MKNYETILSEAGVELTDEQKESIKEAMEENYKPISDYQKKADKVTNLEEQLRVAKESLDKFKDVDPDALNKEIADLKEEMSNKDAEYQSKIADRDFQDILKESISAAKGKNAKAITALLDVDALKASKNQKEDIAAAIKVLAEAEDRLNDAPFLAGHSTTIFSAKFY